LAASLSRSFRDAAVSRSEAGMARVWHGVAVSLAALTVLGAASPARADRQRDQQWWLSTMDITSAHAVTRGAGVTVAVVDSGVDATHPDLAGAIAPGAESLATRDTDGRGTALAALIAGRGHGPTHSVGILGIAPEAMILPIAFAPQPGEVGTPAQLATAIDTAVSLGAKVICIGRGVAPSVALRDAVENALDRDVAVVAADGNRPGEVFSAWPSQIIGVITPVVLDRTGAVAVPPASGHTTGVGVPGVGLVTANTGGGYRTDGSAAGLLCGAVALIRSVAPQLTQADVAKLLRDTATDKGVAGPDSQYGTGALNLVKALQAAPRPASPSPSAANPSAVATPSPTAAESPEPALGWSPFVSSGNWKRWLVLVIPAAFLGLVALVALRRSPS